MKLNVSLTIGLADHTWFNADVIIEGDYEDFVELDTQGNDILYNDDVIIRLAIEKWEKETTTKLAEENKTLADVYPVHHYCISAIEENEPDDWD